MASVVIRYDKSIDTKKSVNAVTPAIVFYKTSLAMHGLGLCFALSLLLLLMLFKAESHYETPTRLEFDVQTVIDLMLRALPASVSQLPR